MDGYFTILKLVMLLSLQTFEDYDQWAGRWRHSTKNRTGHQTAHAPGSTVRRSDRVGQLAQCTLHMIETYTAIHPGLDEPRAGEITSLRPLICWQGDQGPLPGHELGSISAFQMHSPGCCVNRGRFLVTKKRV